MRRLYQGLGLTTIALILLLLSSTPTEAASKKVNLKLSDGATFYGEVLNGKPHGKGTTRWGETEIYSGDWVNGKRQGKGKYTYKLVEGAGVPLMIMMNLTWVKEQVNSLQKPTTDRGLMIHTMEKEKKLRNG